MSKKIVRNFYFSNNLLISIFEYNNEIDIICFYDNRCIHLKENNYNVKKNTLSFKGNLFSNHQIIFNEINLKVVVSSDYIFSGMLNNVEIKGKIHFSNYNFKESPYDYTNILLFDKEENVFSYLEYSYKESKKIKIYTNINNNEINDCEYKKYSKDKLNINVNTYKYLYRITTNIQEHISFEKTKYKFQKIKYNLIISKKSKEPFINQTGDALIIKYKY